MKQWIFVLSIFFFLCNVSSQPVVGVFYPVSGSSIDWKTSDVVIVNVSDSIKIVKVEFFLNNILLGIRDSFAKSPYAFRWAPVVGKHGVKVRVLNATGKVGTDSAWFTVYDTTSPVIKMVDGLSDTISRVEFTMYTRSWNGFKQLNVFLDSVFCVFGSGDTVWNTFTHGGWYIDIEKDRRIYYIVMDDPTFPTGIHSLRIDLIDTAGRTTRNSATFYLKPSLPTNYYVCSSSMMRNLPIPNNYFVSDYIYWDFMKPLWGSTSSVSVSTNSAYLYRRYSGNYSLEVRFLDSLNSSLSFYNVFSDYKVSDWKAVDFMIFCNTPMKLKVGIHSGKLYDPITEPSTFIEALPTGRWVRVVLPLSNLPYLFVSGQSIIKHIQFSDASRKKQTFYLDNVSLVR